MPKNFLILGKDFACASTAMCDHNHSERRLDQELIKASECGFYDCMVKLIDKGANVNAFNKEESNSTALLRAAYHGDDRCVELLIQSGADVNLGDMNGMTALHEACGGDLFLAPGKFRCMELLIKAGANVNAVDNELGNTPLHWAVECDRSLNCVQFLLHSGADVNVQNVYGRTVLMNASRLGCPADVKEFIAAGADVNTHNHDGHAALIIAAAQGSFECVEALLEAGASVNSADNMGNTPLILAASANTHKTSTDVCTVIKLLLKSGARINTRNHSLENALDFYFRSKKVCDIDENVIVLLFAAGESTDTMGNINLIQKLKIPLDSEDSLKQLCRKAIGNHLIMLNPHRHLFSRVSELGLPSILTDYLLYHKSLDTNK